MKPALLDTNVLLALAWPNHQHHAHGEEAAGEGIRSEPGEEGGGGRGAFGTGVELAGGDGAEGAAEEEGGDDGGGAEDGTPEAAGVASAVIRRKKNPHPALSRRTGRG